MNENIFRYPDTNSTRAEIGFLTAKFKSQRIAIIGIGGTGSYILDHVAKTPVKEIHIYDADEFELHNAFRAPGATEADEFEVKGGLKKVNYFFRIYSRMHAAIIPHDKYVTVENIHELSGFDYVFISVDKNAARKIITDKLVEMGVSFIDTGLGVRKLQDSLIGTVRTTTATPATNNHLKNRIGSGEFEDNDYSKNIQISELNCLNAVSAVIKWKKLTGFYQDLKGEHNSLYFINTNKLLNEDFTTQIL
jgi:molybdopterin/thiamine biosynthesis adenylyltransferase